MDALSIVQRAPGAAIATDEEGLMLGWNSAARELFGHTDGEEVAGEALLDVLRVRDIFGNRVRSGHLAIWEMVSRGEPVQTFEYDACRKDGQYVRVAVSVVVVLGPQPGRYQLVYLLRPILRRRKADELIERILADPEGLKPHIRSVNGGPSEVPSLTPRQIEVLRHMAQGSSAAAIADVLGVSLHTVRSHIQSILEKLGARSQMEAVSRAFRDRLI